MFNKIKEFFLKKEGQTHKERPTINIDVVHDERIKRISPSEAQELVYTPNPTTVEKINEAYDKVRKASADMSTSVNLWEDEGFNQEIADLLQADGYEVERVELDRVWWRINWKRV